MKNICIVITIGLNNSIKKTNFNDKRYGYDIITPATDFRITHQYKILFINSLTESIYEEKYDNLIELFRLNNCKIGLTYSDDINFVIEIFSEYNNLSVLVIYDKDNNLKHDPIMGLILTTDTKKVVSLNPIYIPVDKDIEFIDLESIIIENARLSGVLPNPRIKSANF